MQVSRMITIDQHRRSLGLRIVVASRSLLKVSLIVLVQALSVGYTYSAMR